MTDDEFESYSTRYGGDKRRKLYAFFQIRLLLASLVEYIILLDRLAYLTEQVATHIVFRLRAYLSNHLNILGGCKQFVPGSNIFTRDVSSLLRPHSLQTFREERIETV